MVDIYMFRFCLFSKEQLTLLSSDLYRAFIDLFSLEAFKNHLSIQVFNTFDVPPDLKSSFFEIYTEDHQFSNSIPGVTIFNGAKEFFGRFCPFINLEEHSFCMEDIASIIELSIDNIFDGMMTSSCSFSGNLLPQETWHKGSGFIFISLKFFEFNLFVVTYGKKYISVPKNYLDLEDIDVNRAIGSLDKMVMPTDVELEAYLLGTSLQLGELSILRVGDVLSLETNLENSVEVISRDCNLALNATLGSRLGMRSFRVIGNKEY